LFFSDLYSFVKFTDILNRNRHGRDCMVVGFTTTFTISVYHHWSWKFKSRSCKVYSIQHYTINDFGWG